MKYTPTKVRSLAKYLAGLAIGSALLTAGAFYLEFHTESVQHNSGAWADFGTYFGGIVNSVIAIINLLALLLIAVVVTDQQQNTLAAKRIALDMLAQWNGPELHETRRVISDLIEDTPDPDRLPTLREFELARTDSSLHAFRLYHFFEQWAVLNALGEIDHNILSRAIGSRALWYHERLFRHIGPREQDRHIQRTLRLIDMELFAKLQSSDNDA